jgi:asparagine synthase (glutamine-hydrolysing)
MCGIAGIYHFDKERKVNLDILKKMVNIICHRGPDGEGIYIKNNLGIGHRRLSIIDISTGTQPMYNDDKTIIIAFNGEIYNYIELKDELKKIGYNFHTTSDTEVVIKAYEEWGIDCQKRFNGIWSFVLWDERNNHIILSRDRIGEKPLHYCVWDNSLIFGSEIKSILEYGVPIYNRLELVEIYLFLTTIPAPNTFYNNINKVMPGHYLIIKSDKIIERKYWDLPDIDENNMERNKEKVYEKFSYLLKDSVKLRMRSDVPFGAFLSGGLDSSSIVSLMFENTYLPINTFTVGFDDKNYDESKIAQDIANKFKTKHYRKTVKYDDILSIIKLIAFHCDEPFGDSSAIPTAYISKFASKKVKMVLTGDGGDEILSGYNSFQGIKFSSMYQNFPSLIKYNIPKMLKVLRLLTKGNLNEKITKIEKIVETANLSFTDRFINKRIFYNYLQCKILTSHIKSKINIEDYMNEIINKIPYKDDFYKLMYYNFKYDLPDQYLLKVDRMSMAFSLEARVPFLDHRLIEFMINVDKNIKMEGWERKTILRKTVGKKLPKKILKRPKKGFSIPLKKWFKTDFLIENNMLKLKINNFLDTNTLKSIIEEHREGKRDNGKFIWQLLILNESIK